jgi:hypothetical protein
VFELDTFTTAEGALLSLLIGRLGGGGEERRDDDGTRAKLDVLLDFFGAFDTATAGLWICVLLSLTTPSCLLLPALRLVLVLLITYTVYGTSPHLYESLGSNPIGNSSSTLS